MNCPRCGEPMSGGICDHCGFPMRIYNKIVPRQNAEQNMFCLMMKKQIKNLREQAEHC